MTETPSHHTKNYIAPQFNREWYGSLYSCGESDRYYGKLPEPRWRPAAGTGGKDEAIRIPATTQSEINEYMEGYKSERYGQKDWG